MHSDSNVDLDPMDDLLIPRYGRRTGKTFRATLLAARELSLGRNVFVVSGGAPENRLEMISYFFGRLEKLLLDQKIPFKRHSNLRLELSDTEAQIRGVTPTEFSKLKLTVDDIVLKNF